MDDQAIDITTYAYESLAVTQWIPSGIVHQVAKQYMKDLEEDYERQQRHPERTAGQPGVIDYPLPIHQRPIEFPARSIAFTRGDTAG